jgi:hypothetical protein
MTRLKAEYYFFMLIVGIGLGATIGGLLELFGIHAFDYVSGMLGRKGLLALTVGFCVLVAAFAVTETEGAFPKTFWSWLKLIALILFVSLLYFGGCLREARSHPRSQTHHAWPNKPAAGNAPSALQFAVINLLPGVPEPGCQFVAPRP